MKNFVVYAVLFFFLIFSSKGALIIFGDNDNGYNMVKNDRILYNFTEIHPKRTVGLNFTKISQHVQDIGFGAAINENGDLYSWGPSSGSFLLIKKITTAAPVVAIATSASHVLYIQNDKKVFCFGKFCFFVFF